MGESWPPMPVGRRRHVLLTNPICVVEQLVAQAVMPTTAAEMRLFNRKKRQLSFRKLCRTGCLLVVV